MERLSTDRKKEEWLLCPVCGKKTRNRIREDTVLINYPLYCPKCGRTMTVNAKDMQVTIAESDEII